MAFLLTLLIRRSAAGPNHGRCMPTSSRPPPPNAHLLGRCRLVRPSRWTCNSMVLGMESVTSPHLVQATIGRLVLNYAVAALRDSGSISSAVKATASLTIVPPAPALAPADFLPVGFGSS